ncbi:MAG TPA: hypothetical protein VMP01_22420 [Pirellulaceae bacterium]|jgi:hypothetical protein|nr:hypothetical protein [Pirellulaceae bacterium]
MKKLGWGLSTVGGLVFLSLILLVPSGGPGSASEFVFLCLLIVGVFLVVPGVLLGLFGQIVAQLDERLRSLEEKTESRPDRGPTEEKML